MIKKGIKQQIREYFFLYPTAKLRVREIERTLKLPLPSVIKYCDELEYEHILSTLRIGNIRFYTASRSEQYLIEKKMYNLQSLYDSGLIAYIKNELSNPVIVVFGSYSKGEDIEQSDIDLYIETDSRKKIDLGKFEKILKRKIQVFRHKNIKEVANPHLANNIVNGVVLNKYIEVFK